MMRWVWTLLRRRGVDVHVVPDGQLAVSPSLGLGSQERNSAETDDEIDADFAAYGREMMGRSPWQGDCTRSELPERHM